MLKLNKFFLFIVLSLLLVISIWGFYGNKPNKKINFSIERITTDYKTNIKCMKEVNLSELNKLISKNDRFALYVGRENCPYCRIFVEKIAMLNCKYQIYYLNSVTDYNSSPDDMRMFRDMYSIDSVPQLLILEGSRVTRLDIKNSTSQLEILEFLSNLDT